MVEHTTARKSVSSQLVRSRGPTDASLRLFRRTKYHLRRTQQCIRGGGGCWCRLSYHGHWIAVLPLLSVTTGQKKINNTINRLKSSNRTPKIRLVYNSFYTQTCIHLSHTYYYYNNIRDTYMHLVPVWLGAVLRTPYVHMYVPCTVRRAHSLITLHATPN